MKNEQSNRSLTIANRQALWSVMKFDERFNEINVRLYRNAWSISTIEQWRIETSLYSCKRHGSLITDSISRKIQGQQFPVLPWHVAKSVGESHGIFISDLTETKREMRNSIETEGQWRMRDRWKCSLGFVSIDQKMRTCRNGRIPIQRHRSRSCR